LPDAKKGLDRYQRDLDAIHVCIEAAEEQGVDALTIQSAKIAAKRAEQLGTLRGALLGVLDLPNAPEHPYS
jgi:hypothetical protein